jgi:biotin transport system substrate-specific component
VAMGKRGSGESEEKPAAAQKNSQFRKRIGIKMYPKKGSKSIGFSIMKPHQIVEVLGPVACICTHLSLFFKYCYHLENCMISVKSSVVASPFSLSSGAVRVRIFWMLTFAVLTAIGAQVEIPNVPVPYTAQTLFVLLAGALLGPWYGAASMITYLALGAFGFPVFSGFSFGIARLLGPTGGYLLAFPLAALLVGLLSHNRNRFIPILLSMGAGLLLIFAMGALQLWAVLLRDAEQALASGLMIFSWWDGLKLVAAASIASFYRTRVRRSA